MLTPREYEVLVLVSRGLSNAEIAQELLISPNMLETLLRHVFRKLDVRSRTAAVDRGRKLGALV